MKKRGFTLTEVLGVIVILGLIALIIFPNVSRSIKNSRQKLYNEQIALIEENARKWGVDHTSLLPDSGSYYLALNDLVLGGYVTQKELKDPRDDSIMNGCVVISYDSSYNQYKYEYTEVSCGDQPKPDEGQTGSDIVKDNPDVQTNDPDGNPRFVGRNPSNYIRFGNDMYRIIGVFNGQMKIIYWGPTTDVGQFYQNNAGIAFDPNSSNGGHGDFGYNDWAQAKLQTTLNTTYWNTIDSTYQAIVDQSHVWNIGGRIDFNGTREQFYRAERSTTKSPVMGSHLWTGKVGLMYPSDYGYATNGTNDTICNTTNMSTWDDAISQTLICYSTSNNWLANTSNNQWTMIPISSNNYFLFVIFHKGNIAQIGASSDTTSAIPVNNGARPVLYLKTSAKIISGDGTESNPYELKTEPKAPTSGITGSELVKNNPEVATLDPDQNPRFVGGNPKNYVEFGDDMYRIIGIFNNQMKIIYWGPKTAVGQFYQNTEIQFDPDSSNGGHGSGGYNDWNQAKLQTALNTEYWNTIDSTYQAMVDQSHTWNIGGANYGQTRSQYYSAERSTAISDSMTSHIWIGKIGLMYPSDYGYATNGTGCDTDMRYWLSSGAGPVQCYSTSNNWLANTSYLQLTMTPNISSSHNVFNVGTDGQVNSSGARSTSLRARPVLFLKSNVKITNAEEANAGTVSNPFKLSM